MKPPAWRTGSTYPIEQTLSVYNMHMLQKSPPPSNSRHIFWIGIRIILARPATTTPNNTTTLRSSIKMHPPPRLSCALTPRPAVIDAVFRTPLHLQAPPAAATKQCPQEEYSAKHRHCLIWKTHIWGYHRSSPSDETGLQ